MGYNKGNAKFSITFAETAVITLQVKKNLTKYE